MRYFRNFKKDGLSAKLPGKQLLVKAGCLNWITLACIVASVFTASAVTDPSALQDSLLRNYSELRFGAFFHFNMNTFSGTWGCARQDPKKFNPTQLNCKQWASACKSAKMKFGILTVKHHDGFVIWPSAVTAPGKTAYTIAQSSVPTRDVVAEFTKAFRDSGLEPHLFYSVHDVANSISCDKDRASDWNACRAYVLGQITELLTKYGDIPLLCTDGYGWFMGHGPKAIPYQDLRDTIRKLQPHCLYFDHNSCTSPWEEDVVYYEEPKGGIYCPTDNIYASCQAITIMTGSASDGPLWFIGNPDRPGPNPQTYVSTSAILDHLTKLEPRWCNFIINMPPDNRGLLTDATVSICKSIGWSPNTSRKPLPTQPRNIIWPAKPSLITASSTDAGSDRFGVDYSADYAIDGRTDADNGGKGQVANSQRLWKSSGALPQNVTMDLGKLCYLDIFGSLPRQDLDDFTGRITSYTLQLSRDNKTFKDVASGTWSGTDRTYHIVTFTYDTARYVRLIAKGGANKDGSGGGSSATISEIDVGWTGILPTPTPIKPGVSEMSQKNQGLSSANKTFKVSGERFSVPSEFAGKMNTLELCDLSGKTLYKVTTDKQVIDIVKDYGKANGVHFIRIK